MIALSNPDRTKLVAILGMLASDFPGERSAAGLLASRMLRDRGLQWSDLIAEPETSWSRDYVSAEWHADLAFAHRHVLLSSMWERQFICSIAGRDGLSIKQRKCLARIADALRAKGKV